jgi:hypothetical protein
VTALAIIPAASQIGSLEKKRRKPNHDLATFGILADVVEALGDKLDIRLLHLLGVATCRRPTSEFVTTHSHNSNSWNRNPPDARTIANPFALFALFAESKPQKPRLTAIRHNSGPTSSGRHFANSANNASHFVLVTVSKDGRRPMDSANSARPKAGERHK